MKDFCNNHRVHFFKVYPFVSFFPTVFLNRSKLKYGPMKLKAYEKFIRMIELGAISLRKMFSYSELFWSAFSRIRTEYGEIRSISPYSVQMGENADQNNPKYGHFLCNISLQTKGFCFSAP